jgi:predicted AAA+ superfamily ATPase
MFLRPRQLTSALHQALTVDRVVALMGSRQSGKTTLVRHLLQANRETQYYNLKDVAVRRHLSANARSEFQHYAHRLIILDEVQQQPDLLA